MGRGNIKQPRCASDIDPHSTSMSSTISWIADLPTSSVLLSWSMVLNVEYA
ncbi:uncharacterized protein LACBIDRAFT_314179 [Laccaria bicolor S238N-H82]|uniref:Predicted protein n=1 Tax=Laccaria bicolor (strain S238N-H82 / ATCC MYA-4686) TaxID=486041 RepID=B0D1S1_LACBS|nr:uncharacterized protein LACBIDRAFT_314179 [Laccaria bicolor S238N-H82]EDR12042.1 predicted protein [Laccaria bicolor S238N-H82]|eukprot:XP_001877939.1 predicted protein [Laccaria bicolor S238N-H82]